MKSLELKIPPPVVTVLVAAVMWGIARVAPSIEIPAFIRMVAAIAIAAVGLTIGAAGVRRFRRARTTLSPHQPQAASSLVTSGIYRMTRNPMYLGLVCVLVAWAVFLSSAWALLGLVVFMLYMGRFQIGPEERMLTAVFGAPYTAYRSRVRRWL